MADNSSLQKEGCISESEAVCSQIDGVVNVAEVMPDKMGPTWAEHDAAQENMMAEKRSQFSTCPSPHDFVQTPMSVQCHGQGWGRGRTHGLGVDCGMDCGASHASQPLRGRLVDSSNDVQIDTDGEDETSGSSVLDFSQPTVQHKAEVSPIF